MRAGRRARTSQHEERRPFEQPPNFSRSPDTPASPDGPPGAGTAPWTPVCRGDSGRTCSALAHEVKAGRSQSGAGPPGGPPAQTRFLGEQGRGLATRQPRGGLTQGKGAVPHPGAWTAAGGTPRGRVGPAPMQVPLARSPLSSTLSQIQQEEYPPVRIKTRGLPHKTDSAACPRATSRWVRGKSCLLVSDPQHSGRAATAASGWWSPDGVTRPRPDKRTGVLAQGEVARPQAHAILQGGHPQATVSLLLTGAWTVEVSPHGETELTAMGVRRRELVSQLDSCRHTDPQQGPAGAGARGHRGHRALPPGWVRPARADWVTSAMGTFPQPSWCHEKDDRECALGRHPKGRGRGGIAGPREADSRRREGGSCWTDVFHPRSHFDLGGLRGEHSHFGDRPARPGWKASDGFRSSSL